MNTKERGLMLPGRYLKYNETEVNEIREKIKNLTYNRQHQLLNFTILGNVRVIFLNQKQDGISALQVMG